MNWQQEDNKYLSFLSNVDYRHRKIKDNGWIHDHSIKAELGYFKYSDSLWLKSADQFKVGLHWTERSSRKIIHSYSLLMQSQFLKSYRFERDEEGVAVARLKGFFMAPGLIELAYGLTWNFYDLCRLNIAFATCRLRIYPRKGEEQNTDESLFFTADRIVKSEYGFSSQLFITRDFYGKHLIWENQSRLFFNAMSRNGVHFDSNNRFAVRFLKFLQFRIDTHFIYDPDFSKKASYRQELLLGIFYELKK